MAYTREELERITRNAAMKVGVPSDIALGLVHTESGFNPRAVSPVGAKGLTQIMPETGKVDLGMSDEDFTNPQVNAEKGLGYLKHQYDRVSTEYPNLDEEEKWVRALRAYNGGYAGLKRRNWEPTGPQNEEYPRRVLGAAREFAQKIHGEKGGEKGGAPEGAGFQGGSVLQRKAWVTDPVTKRALEERGLNPADPRVQEWLRSRGVPLGPQPDTGLAGDVAAVAKGFAKEVANTGIGLVDLPLAVGRSMGLTEKRLEGYKPSPVEEANPNFAAVGQLGGFIGTMAVPDTILAKVGKLGELGRAGRAVRSGLAFGAVEAAQPGDLEERAGRFYHGLGTGIALETLGAGAEAGRIRSGLQGAGVMAAVFGNSKILPDSPIPGVVQQALLGGTVGVLHGRGRGKGEISEGKTIEETVGDSFTQERSRDPEIQREVEALDQIQKARSLSNTGVDELKRRAGAWERRERNKYDWDETKSEYIRRLQEAEERERRAKEEGRDLLPEEEKFIEDHVSYPRINARRMVRQSGRERPGQRVELFPSDEYVTLGEVRRPSPTESPPMAKVPEEIGGAGLEPGTDVVIAEMHELSAADTARFSEEMKAKARVGREVGEWEQRYGEVGRAFDERVAEEKVAVEEARHSEITTQQEKVKGLLDQAEKTTNPTERKALQDEALKQGQVLRDMVEKATPDVEWARDMLAREPELRGRLGQLSVRTLKKIRAEADRHELQGVALAKVLRSHLGRIKGGKKAALLREGAKIKAKGRHIDALINLLRKETIPADIKEGRTKVVPVKGSVASPRIVEKDALGNVIETDTPSSPLVLRPESRIDIPSPREVETFGKLPPGAARAIRFEELVENAQEHTGIITPETSAVARSMIYETMTGEIDPSRPRRTFNDERGRAEKELDEYRRRLSDLCKKLRGL